MTKAVIIISFKIISYLTKIAPTGHPASASSSQVMFATDAFLGRAFPFFNSKELGQVATQAPHPMHLLASTEILCAIQPPIEKRFITFIKLIQQS
jgi:hypothetical protein